jgi:hypothetical protein
MQTPGQGEQMLAAANVESAARAAVAQALNPSQRPTIGRIVLVNLPAGGDARTFAPGIITRVWSDTAINVSVFRDGDAHVSPYTSLVYDEHGHTLHSWSWPPRV